MRYLDQFISRSKSRVYNENLSRQARLTNRIATVILSLAVITLFSIYRIDPLLDMTTANIPTTLLRIHWSSPEQLHLHAISGDYDWFIFSDESITWDTASLHRCLRTLNSPISVTTLSSSILVASHAAILSCQNDTLNCLRSINQPLDCLTFSPIDLETHKAGLSEIYYNQPAIPAVAFLGKELPADLKCTRPALPPIARGPVRNFQVKVFVSGDASEARSSWGKHFTVIECMRMGCLDEVVNAEDVDFAVIVEGDTFINVKNLKDVLSGVDADVPVYAGHVMLPPTVNHPGDCKPYMSLGAGVVLSKASIRLLHGCDRDIQSCLATAGILPQTGLEGVMQPLSYDEVKSGCIPPWLKACSFNVTGLAPVEKLVTFHFMNGRMHELVDSSVQF